jgi:hypothetical protein
MKRMMQRSLLDGTTMFKKMKTERAGESGGEEAGQGQFA